MHPYSVLLLYPAHLRQEDWSSYYAHVTAPTVSDAVQTAQREAAAVNHTADPQDFIPLIVLSGHHDAEMTSWDL